MKITLDIPDEDIRAALQTAKKNPSYWARGLEYNREGAEIFALVFPRDALEMPLDIERGLCTMILGGYEIGEIGFWDGPQSDAFVQYAAFGKIVYG